MSKKVTQILEKINSQKNVAGVITLNGEGIPIESTLDKETTQHYARRMFDVADVAVNNVHRIKRMKGLDTYQLKFLRLRTKNREIMLGPEDDFVMIVIQNPLKD